MNCWLSSVDLEGFSTIDPSGVRNLKREPSPSDSGFSISPAKLLESMDLSYVNLTSTLIHSTAQSTM